MIVCKYCKKEFEDDTSNFFLLAHLETHEDDKKIGEYFKRVKNEQ